MSEASSISNNCEKCKKPVYMAEKIIAIGKSFHKSCFVCTLCNTRLDSTTMSNHDGKIYCNACYSREFGPKGYGYGAGAGALKLTK